MFVGSVHSTLSFTVSPHDIFCVLAIVFNVIVLIMSMYIHHGTRECFEATKPKRKIERTTNKVKKELIDKHESGVHASDLFTMFKMLLIFFNFSCHHLTFAIVLLLKYTN